MKQLLRTSPTAIDYFRRPKAWGCGRKERSLESVLGRPRCLPSGGLVFAIVLDVLEDLVREVQLPVYVAGVGVVGVGADGELLLLLPLEDALAPWRIVAPLLDLLNEGPGLGLVGV